MTFGEAILLTRKRKGHTQADVAAALGTNKMTVSRIERGVFVKLTDTQMATLQAAYGPDLPAYLPDPTTVHRAMLDELHALRDMQVLVATSRDMRRFQAAQAMVAAGEAYLIRDETVYPRRGPSPVSGIREPYQRLWLRPAMDAEAVI